MKLHSDTLQLNDIHLALKSAQAEGNVTDDITFVILRQAGSRSRRYAYEIQLGTFDKASGPGKSRHHKNLGTSPDRTLGVYAATYDEWGHFISALLHADPDATFGPYKGLDSFDVQTRYAY